MWFEGYVYITVKREATRTESPPKTLSIRAELGAHVAEGVLQVVDAEYRFRIPAPGKTGSVDVIAVLAGANGSVTESIRMVAAID
jgi:hypothetical protein